MAKKTLLVTGSDGQLGSEFQEIASYYPDFTFLFANSKRLDITDQQAVSDFFETNNIDYCINCAAYTQVDQAETDQELAYAVNVTGVANLAAACKEQNAILIHISTDFVFDGSQTRPYTETDSPNPINYYGKTKYLGEQEIAKTLSNHYIIRTSWLYGKKGANFVKTILRLAAEKESLTVVNNQFGAPTNAEDLAKFILYLIQNSFDFGIYHLSNRTENQVSWYDFAKEILKLQKKTIPLLATNQKFGGVARPNYSVMSLEKTTRTNFRISHWKKSLEKYIKSYE